MYPTSGEPTSLPVINPATLEKIDDVPNSTSADIDAAITAANKAASSWAQSSERPDQLLACARVLKGNSLQIARLLTLEQGKPLREAMEEVMGASHWLRTVAEFDPLSVRQIATPRGKASVEYKPVGTVAAITPWNYPIILAMWKIAPALLTGNCVIVKPSPFTPLGTMEVCKLLAEQLPPGVLQVVTGDDQTGRTLIAHSGIDHVSLTGSVSAGRLVGAQAGADLKSVTLELGGNDAALVLDDADPAAIAADLFSAAFKNCGQTCTAIKRIYVHRSRHDELVEALADLVKKVVIGDGLQSGTQMGPICNEPQQQRLQSLLADALQRGGTQLGGSELPDLPGYFHQPSIVTGLSDDALLVTEEQFGPLLPILPFDDTCEAVTRINRSEFGLGGSVWSSDPERAAAIADQLECGTSWVNQHSLTDPSVPFGGIKSSGLGSANGKEGLEEFTRIRVKYGNPAVS